MYPGHESNGTRPSVKSHPAITYFSLSDGAMVPVRVLRMNSISLAYVLPDAWMKKIKLKGASVVASSNNVFKLSNFRGLDPQNSSSHSPALRTINLSLNCNF